MSTKNKKSLLIAGGTGFIGSNVAKEAVIKGYKVTIISKNKVPLYKRLKNIEYINVDIRNNKNLFNKLKKNLLIM